MSRDRLRENSLPEWEPEDPSGIDPYIRFGRADEHVRVMSDFQELVDRQCAVTITNATSLQIRMRPYQLFFGKSFADVRIGGKKLLSLAPFERTTCFITITFTRLRAGAKNLPVEAANDEFPADGGEGDFLVAIGRGIRDSSKEPELVTLHV